MDLIQLIIISVVQGVTEFLPVSSSAHLILLPQLMDWEDQGLAIDVAAHLGSLFAVIFYFRKDFRSILINGLKITFKSNYAEIDNKLLWFIILASIPALVAGFVFREIISDYMRNPLIISFTTIFFGLLLWLSDIFGRRDREISSMNKKDALIIGFSQILAFIPGTSRSGITMTTGLLLGLDRNTAVKFSFFMSVPIIIAGASYEAINLVQLGNNIDLFNFIITIFLSAVSSLLAIHWFLKFLDKIGMVPFVIYRLVLGITLIFIFI
jgi:undecaprenyl-diphosphatase